MNETKTVPMLVPKYVSEFQCVGSECPDTCCANWSIPIDKATFSQYRRVVHPVIKPLLKSYLTQDKEHVKSFPLHGKLNLRESDGHCPMHSGSKLCSIQQHLGEQSLSDTCFMYPRTVTKFGERIEQCLTLSCPEAARLALTRMDSFDFALVQLPVRITSAANLGCASGFDLETMDSVRTFAIQLFQTVELTCVERLFALGWLCNQLDELSSRNAHDETSSLLSEMTDMVEDGALKPLVEQLDAQRSISVTVFYLLFKNQRRLKRPPHQQMVVNSVLVGLGIDDAPKTDILKVEENYKKGTMFLQAENGYYEQVMGKYLLNDLLRETFPWGQTSALLHYRRLLTRFGILRLMFAGVASARSTALDLETMVHIVQVFCRLYQHNDEFAKEAELCLQDLDWNSLERLYTLLK